MYIASLLCQTEHPADTVGAIIDRPLSVVMIIGFRAVGDRPYIQYLGMHPLQNKNQSGGLLPVPGLTGTTHLFSVPYGD